MEELGERIRRLRTEKGLSQVQLAGKAEISQSHLSAIERGGVEPSASVLQRIARALGVLIGEVLGERSKLVPTHHTIPKQVADTELPTSLVDYIGLCKAKGKPLSPEEIRMLGGIRYEGKVPRTADDWHYIMESIKRTIR